MQANANGLQCQVGALHVVQSGGAIDYALVDFLGGHLKPQVYVALMTGELSEDYVMFFKHSGLRSNIADLVYEVKESTLSGLTTL